MKRGVTKRKPTFLWQAVLIVLPVILLAAVGFLSLRQDKLLAASEARERARAIADDSLARVVEPLNDTNAHFPGSYIFQVSTKGNLISPPPLTELPEPKPLPVQRLSAEQLALWNKICATSFQFGNSNAVQVCRQFLDTNPTGEFAANGTYDLALALYDAHDFHNAVSLFTEVRSQFPDAVTEAGVGISLLAEFKILEAISLGIHDLPSSTQSGLVTNQPKRTYRRSHARNAIPPVELVLPMIQSNADLIHVPIVTLAGFCSNLVSHPTPLTPFFLNAVEERFNELDSADRRVTYSQYPALRQAIETEKAAWARDEQSRNLYKGARRYAALKSPEMFWFANDGTDWLANGNRNGTNILFVCRPNQSVQDQINSAAAVTRWPEYMSASFEIGGRTLLSSNSDLRPWKMVYHTGRGTSVRKEFLGYWLPGALSSNAPAAELLASAVHTENGADLLKVNVYLTSPDTLFKRQNARTFWFGLLIASAAIAALVGLASTWRGFAEQLRLNEMQSNFVSSVSHELRSPIAAVRLMAENLERGKVEPARQGEYFRFIGQECRRLSGLIQNVLDFSRIEQGRKQYDFEPTDVRALVESTVVLMRTYAEEKRVHLKFVGLTGEPSLNAFELNIDARAIQQALINLIDNAIKHSPAESEVLVGLENHPTEGPLRQPAPVFTVALPATPEEERENALRKTARSVVIWVEDKGRGIPLEEQERIFERFYRIGSELRRETEGVGIGLSIVKHVVEAHDGTVSVSSAPGEGSRFTIELPVWNASL